MIDFAAALKDKRRSKYAIPDLKEFAQMLKEGEEWRIPDDVAPTLVKYGPQDDATFSLWVKCCLEDQGLTCRFVRQPNHNQIDVQGTCSHLQYMCDAFYDRAGDCIVLGNRGSAKCWGRGTPIMMWDGTVKNVEDVVVGDKLMGDDSKPRNVLSTTTGYGPLYKVTPVKGDPYVVNDVHILSLKYGHSSKIGGVNHDGDVVDISVQDYLKLGKTHKEILKGYKVPVQRFGGDHPDLFLPPYFMGVWLGDGSRHQFSITTPEPEIVGYLYAMAERFGLKIRVIEEHSKNMDYGTYVFTNGKLVGGGIGSNKNPLQKYIRDTGLQEGKFIPHEYKTASWEDRLELLAGLMDTDGHLQKDGCTYGFVSKYEQLANDVAFLARSLGLAAYVRVIHNTCSNASGGPKTGTYYRMNISGSTDIIPCRVKRKQANPRRLHKDVTMTGITLEPVGDGEYFGFSIDGNRRLLMGDYTVTHNTLGFAAMLLIEAMYKPDIELAHLGAIKTQADKCYDYFKKMVSHPLFADFLAQRPLASKTLFKNGSKVEILIGSMTGLNSPHPVIASVDEVELMEWKLMQEAFNMARSKGNYPSATRLTSTRKFSTGTMQRLIDEANERGFKLYQWNVWDTVETCVMDIDSESANVLVPFEYVDPITRKEKVISVPETCLSCSMVATCKGQAKFSNAGGGVVTMADTLKNYAALDDETWISQVVCQQPGRSDLIYPMFEDAVHIVDYAEILKEWHGEDYQYNHDINLPVYAGQDAGFGCPATIYCQVIEDIEGGDPYMVVFDENYDKDIAPSVFIKDSLRPKQEEYNVETYYIDPSGQALLAEMEIEGLYVQDAENDVEYGLDIVKALFATRRLLIDKSCKMLIWELKRYKRLPSGKPLKKDDHAVDSLRYAAVSVGVYESVMTEAFT